MRIRIGYLIALAVPDIRKWQSTLADSRRTSRLTHVVDVNGCVVDVNGCVVDVNDHNMLAYYKFAQTATHESIYNPFSMLSIYIVHLSSP